MANLEKQRTPVKLAYIGCWYKKDMYSHNCSNLVDSLRAAGTDVDVITSNCRCYSSATRFAMAKDELINENCSPIAIPHAPHDPGLKHGRLASLAVKIFRLDLVLAMARGFLYYMRSRKADVIHFDQVLEAFGFIPFFIVVTLAHWFGQRVVVTVHEIDPFQKRYPSFNRCYRHCAAIFAFSENMKKQIVAMGAPADKIKVIRYGVAIPELVRSERKQYLYFGGHFILRGKGYLELLDALVQLRARGVRISLVIYVGNGCNGLEEAKQMAAAKQLDDVISWQEFYTGPELAKVYQRSKACIIPFSGGSARHPLTCAMVNATPVIATRAVDIPEYLGDLGIYIEGSATSIADAIEEVESGRKSLEGIGESLRAKALAELDYRNIGAELSDEFIKISGKQPFVTIQPRAIA